MKILVTGATGFIGGRLTERLAEQGHEVIAASRAAEAQASRFPAGVTPRSLDITDPTTFGDAFDGVDVVVHAAALVGDFGSREDFFRFDEGGTRAVLEGARAAGVPRFIHVSSIAVYGDEGEGPIPESTPRVDPETFPLSYFAAKSAAEAVVEAARADGYPAIIVRPANVYGPSSHHWTDRPASLAKKGLAGVPKGCGPSNTVYVDNVCALIEACCVHEAAPGETFHVVDPVEDWPAHDFGRFFDGYAEALGKKGVPRQPALLLEGVARASEVASRLTGKPPLISRMALAILNFQGWFPMDHAREVLGFEAPVSAEDGMARTQAYIRAKYG